MDLGLKDKVAMVAGGSSGLGLAIAKEFASEGANVAIGARTEARLNEALRDVDEAGPGHVMATSVDVQDADQVHKWVAEVLDSYAALHVVVGNAGGPPLGLATDFGLDDYRRAIDLNLLSAISMAQAALPHLQAAGWGRLLFITSTGVKEPAPRVALSNTARVGILAYAKSLVPALGKGNITVNVLAPGFTRTPRFEEAFPTPEAQLSLAENAIPLGRIAEPEEFAAAAAFLASTRASYITGTVFQVDGGATKTLF